MTPCRAFSIISAGGLIQNNRISTQCGGIAQLGERLNGIQEVSGSIPLISTIEKPVIITITGFSFFLVTIVIICGSRIKLAEYLENTRVL